MTSDEIKEIEALKRDKIIQEHLLGTTREQIARDLMGDVGQDIKDVINGRKYVKTPFLTVLKYKIQYFLYKFFDFF